MFFILELPFFVNLSKKYLNNIKTNFLDRINKIFYNFNMLKIENLSYLVSVNNDGKDILKNINLDFLKGKIYVITGPNGSGKSTLVKLIMGILSPTEGKITFNGNDITNLKINERAKLGIAYAFQQPVTFKGLKVKDLLNIASGKENDFNTLCDYLSKVGLCAKDYINRPLDDKLSGGELKRIELAMVLARNASVNIFDEPEAGIDLWSFENLTKVFKELSSTTIIVSHQTKILEIADTVILLKNGTVEKIGKYSEVKPYINSDMCGKLRGKNGQD